MQMATGVCSERRIELKYRLDCALAEDVQRWAREHLGFDPHCTDAAGEHYDVETLYFDTPALDLFHRSGVVGRAKHRIRRYGNSPLVWLETKRKQRSVVDKRRTAISREQLQPCSPSGAEQLRDAPCCGQWFLDSVHRRGLMPVVQIGYRRFVKTAVIDGRHLRLTIDSELRGHHANGWQPALGGEAMLIDAPLILELKFHNSMPHLFKQLLRTFAIPATGFSKYRAAVESCTTFPSGVSARLPERSRGLLPAG